MSLPKPPRFARTYSPAFVSLACVTLTLSAPFAPAQDAAIHDHEHEHDDHGHLAGDSASNQVSKSATIAVLHSDLDHDSEPHAHSPHHDDHDSDSPDLRLFRGISVDFGEHAGVGANISGIFFPEIFVQSVFGDSTNDPASLAIGDHDPNREATLQSLHFALEMELGEYLSGFVNYDGTTDARGDYGGQLEEGFIHVKALPWLSIGGGQFLNAFGFHNERHVHAWDFVDQYLVSGRMLNEGELTTQGGEAIFTLPTPWQSTLTLGGGGVRNHGHDEAHAHGDAEPDFEPDGANFDNWVVTGNYRADYGSHENMAGTLSAAVGENGFGKSTQVYGVGHEITWNPEQPLYDDAKNTVIGKYRGGSFGAGSLRWRNELMYRNIEAFGVSEHHDEDDEHGHADQHHDDDGEDDDHDEAGPRSATIDEFGLYSQLQYGLSEFTTASLRGEWVSGINALGLDERLRISPSVGIYLNAARNVHLRLQYNYDHSEEYRDDHSVWLQIGIAWGAPSHHGHHQH